MRGSISYYDKENCFNIIYCDIGNRNSKSIYLRGRSPSINWIEYCDYYDDEDVMFSLVQSQPHPEGGKLFISTRNENGNVAIALKDTGCGIPEEYKDRIFEPFFTTKMDWKGTGLGLSICYDITKTIMGI